ncbi:DUF6544 family protein [Adhaeribacter rhizoryzae]|uniref:Uncharacterized protein n=1 Tax=Adhaeribacter rhizoryzae TaxID=2607907 RepID=A0A5M6D448_9BACT|nr:DUF6544 family protein [Adhaeribacter rhizoryzae]KAA5539955.1 hypothetical protein F0145_23490 [Adhaeribacter rhizoryzae]
MHALIHLLGFVSAFRLASVPQLTGKTIFTLPTEAFLPLGLLWLVAGSLFFASALLFLLKKEWWWMIGATGLVVSQALIILYWPEAKFGTVANLIMLTGIVLAYGSWNFKAMVTRELARFNAPLITEREIITPKRLSDLPPVVQQWLHHAQVIGKENIQTVHLQQSGEMRISPEGKWMPVIANEYFTVAKPGFIWVADVKAAPFLHLAGRDKYENGRGHMLIKLLSVYPVADAKGKETDQGTLLRYLGEMVWFPTAALSNYIRWEQLSENAARATMSYGGVTAAGIFRFNKAGDVISFEAKRYYDRKEGPTLENWLVTVDPHSCREFNGIRVPTKSDVTWKLKTGDFTWFKLEVTDVVFNKAINPSGTLQPTIAETNSYEMAR